MKQWTGWAMRVCYIFAAIVSVVGLSLSIRGHDPVWRWISSIIWIFICFVQSRTIVSQSEALKVQHVALEAQGALIQKFLRLISGQNPEQVFLTSDPPPPPQADQ